MPVVAKEDMLAQKGRDLGVSEWLEIDQDRVNAFADVTEDHQFIHVDPEAAAQTPFGGTIAHGFLTLSLLPRLTAGMTILPDGMVMGINYGLNRVRFLAPVKVGKRIRARATVADVQEKGPGQFLVTTDVTVEIEGEDKPALVAEWLGLFVTA